MDLASRVLAFERGAPEHIEIVDMHSGRAQRVEARALPLERRFVFLEDGLGTWDFERATDARPVLRVERSPVDRHGRLIDERFAVLVVVRELGARGRPLRTSFERPPRARR